MNNSTLKTSPKETAEQIAKRLEWETALYLYGHRQDEDLAGVIEGIHGPQGGCGDD